jgi:hypothetical protein
MTLSTALCASAQVRKGGTPSAVVAPVVFRMNASQFSGFFVDITSAPVVWRIASVLFSTANPVRQPSNKRISLAIDTASPPLNKSEVNRAHVFS